MGSLFESHPHVIAEITFLLDKERKPGKRNWKYLADMFGVPRSESENFGESIHENPTKQLFQYLRVKKPRLTTGELKELLRIHKMQVVLDVLAESNKGWVSCYLLFASFSAYLCKYLEMFHEVLNLFSLFLIKVYLSTQVCNGYR